jgi:hypothetical protein
MRWGCAEIRRSPGSRSGFQVDQSDAEIGLLLSFQFGRRVGQYDLQRRPDLALEQVSTARRAVGKPEHDVNVETRLAVVADGNVADRAQDLALLGDLDFPVVLLLEIEPADNGAFEGADGGQGGRGYPGVVGGFRQRRKGLFARLENDDAGLGSRVAGYLAVFIAVRPRCAGYGGLP